MAGRKPATSAAGTRRCHISQPETMPAPMVGGEFVVSYAHGREIVLTFGQPEPPGLTGHGALPVQD